MAYNITAVEEFDHKRTKVTLDFGEGAFLLYKGECRSFGIRQKQELSDEEYARIRDDILIPRAKKRVLYYIKNADKTRHQIRQKLREGYYPEEVIDTVMEFLDRYGFADDRNYAESYVEELRGTRSRREIEAKLLQRGLKPEDVRLQLETLTEEDELAACRKALAKKYPGGVAGIAADEEDPASENAGMSGGERQKAYVYLARKGFSAGVMRKVLEESADSRN